MMSQNDQTHFKNLAANATLWQGLMSQYRSCIANKCDVVNKLFRSFEVKMWKCYHVTMNSPYFTFFAKLTQRWCNVLISTSRTNCEFDVEVTKVYRRYHCNMRDRLGGDFFSRFCGNVGITLWFNVVVWVLWRRYEFNVAISTLQQHCQYNINNTPWIKLTIQRWNNVRATL